MSAVDLAPGYTHEAVLYAGVEEFVAIVDSFIRPGLETGEPVAVVAQEAKLDALRETLGDDANTVHFADMAQVGHNPARLMQAWFDLLQTFPADAQVRAVGEPIFPGRSAEQIAECHVQESVSNYALADVHALSCICPYDTSALDPTVIDEVLRTHPLVREHAHSHASDQYTDPLRWHAPPLAPPPRPVERHDFDVTTMHRVRRLVADYTEELGFNEQRTDDAIIAVNEAMTNSVIHGGGRGSIACWTEDRTFVCEVRDHGRIEDPLAGRRRPASSDTSGHGLWIINQLCDLAQLRSDATGTTLRLRVSAH
jgi:anti-sigma regulatory factor (Ser/Thr protein kinase)